MSVMDKLLDAVEWEECPGDPPEDDSVPYMTHKGVLRIGNIELPCAVLSDGQRVFYGDLIEQMLRELGVG